MESSSDESSEGPCWIDVFVNYKGNEIFCEVDKEYILDRFNLTGLNAEIPRNYQKAIDLMCDKIDFTDMNEVTHAEINNCAFSLYGLIHARFILTSRGLSRMLEKYKKADFGRCPRVLCKNQHLLPVGLHDQAKVGGVKFYCASCEDVYNPKVSRYESIDGAFFGTTFPHLFFQTYPELFPSPQGSSRHNNNRVVEKYVPRIFGFKIHGFPISSSE